LIATLIAVYVNIFNDTSVVYTHLFYIPIILAGIWYRKLAILVAICLGILHVAINIDLNTFAYDSIIRAAFFIIIGYFAASFAERNFVLLNEFKDSEAKIWDIRDKLEILVQERTEELKNANDSLKKEILAKKQVEKALRNAKNQAELYVDLISHDIGNMNQAIMGYLEIALDVINPRGEERELLLRPLEIIDSSSKLIGNVRKLQHAGAGEIPSEVCDLGEILVEVKSHYSGMPGRDMVINCDPVVKCFVMANELLKDVFSNIIENSIRHSSGPLTINIGLASEKKDKCTYYLVSIEDNGPGIPDAQKVKVLKDFPHDKDKPVRKGFGLHLVRTLVEIFNGYVWVEDRVPGDHTKGCKFVVMLPKVEKKQEYRSHV
jgi:signal transduction histidine kinase